MASPQNFHKGRIKFSYRFATRKLSTSLHTAQLYKQMKKQIKDSLSFIVATVNEIHAIHEKKKTFRSYNFRFNNFLFCETAKLPFT